MNDLYKEIGRRIREKRKKMGISQNVLSERLEISATHMGSLERGNRKISLDLAIKAAGILDVPPEYLIFGKYFVSKQDEMEQSLIEISDRLDDETKALISSLFQKLANTTRSVFGEEYAEIS